MNATAVIDVHLRAGLRALPLLLLALAVGAEDFDGLFAAAERDDGLVALVERVSAAVPHLPPGDALDLADRAQPFCRRLFFAPNEAEGGERVGLLRHAVAKGEHTTGIARRYNTTIEMIVRLNRGLKPSRIEVDDELTVLDLAATPLELVVMRSAFRLLLWRGPVLVGCFKVGLGAERSPTPLGATEVWQCVRNPEWRDPDTKKIFKPTEPGNVLGGYWIAFQPGDDRRFKGIGMHGYTAEKSERWLGQPGSHGCVRLVQDDIAALFALVRPGMKVTVRE
jgi:lipoprotein-anchoring transpeptidase ErfK/SrfK